MVDDDYPVARTRSALGRDPGATLIVAAAFLSFVLSVVALSSHNIESYGS